MPLTIRKKLFPHIALLAIFCVFIYSTAKADECLNCHTSPGKLIKITREIEKSRPVIESKSKGPG